MRLTLPVALATCLVLAGCGKQEPAAPAADGAQPAATGQATPAEAPEWDASGVPVAGAELTVTPNPVDFCTDKLHVVDISWDVTVANPTGLQIWLEDVDGSRKLWIAPTERTGTKATGKWMREGAKVIAVDTSKSRVLNTVTMTAAAPCG